MDAVATPASPRSEAPPSIDDLVPALAALAQPTRLQVFRLLMRAGPAGRAAGDLAAALGVPSPTLSFHLRELARSRVVTRRTAGRNVYYAADFGRVAALLRFLTEDCCGGNPCLPIATAALPSPDTAPRRCG